MEIVSDLYTCMKILSAEEIRLWDQFTIQNEPISSIDLMERAAIACVDWLLKKYPDAPSFGIFCGKGNNGGDGLAIARLLPFIFLNLVIKEQRIFKLTWRDFINSRMRTSILFNQHKIFIIFHPDRL